MNCDFCNTKFNSKSSLNFHVKNAKYCLVKQKQINPTIKEENTKTYDGGLGSYTLSGIGSLGLLSMFNKRNIRKNNIK